MIPLNTYKGLLSRLDVICPNDVNHCLVALLFADPGFDLVKKEVIPFLHRYNARSGPRVNFFFAGFITDAETWQYRDAMFITKGPNNLNWSFSAEAFECIRREFEQETKWRYSGGVDFILFDGHRKGPKHENSMNLFLDEVVTMNLLEGREQKILPPISQLFEEIFRFAENKGSKSTVFGFSDAKILGLCRTIAEGAIDACLPKDVAKAFREGRAYSVRNLKI